MTLTATEPVLTAVRDLLRVHLPQRVDGRALAVEKDATSWASPLVLVELATTPNLTRFAMGGHDWATLSVQTTAVMAQRPQARLLGDQIRTVLVALTPHGRLVTPLVLPGHTVLEIASAGDGHADDSGTEAGRTAQWVETFTIRYT